MNHGVTTRGNVNVPPKTAPWGIPWIRTRPLAVILNIAWLTTPV
uniref:Uncharacterized protein n=1 Tax=Pseudomonas phage KV2023 TaxID=3234047 RepID=A0AB39C6V9_9CAUD